MKIRIISAIVAFLIFIPVFLMGGNIFKVAFYLLALQGLREFINVREKKKEFPNIIKLIAYICLTLFYFCVSINENLIVNFDFRIITCLLLVLFLPIILYNVPSWTGCNIIPETYLELSKHPNIVGIKEANGDISSVVKTISICGDNIDIYSGNDEQAIPIMSVGGKGVISVFANICPKISHDICSKFLNGDIKESNKIQREYYELMSDLFCDVNPIPVKAAMNILGFECGECRMPLNNLNSSNFEKLKNAMRKYKLI